MKTKFRTVVALSCVTVCVLLTSGCATVRGWSSTIKQSLQKLHAEDEFKKQKYEESNLLKQLSLPPEKLAAINPQHMVVAATNYLDSPFIACRHRLAMENDRIIYIDADITFDDTLPPDPGHEGEIKVEIKKGQRSATFHLENRHYIWLRFTRKDTEVAATKNE